MRVQQQPAYILRLLPYSESSRLVTVFTRDYGRLTLLAKGARRLKSRQRGLLISFLPLLVSWSGKGELPILTQLEADGLSHKLRGNDYFCGFYIHELIIKLLHIHDPHIQLFDAYEHCLKQLACSRENSQVALRLFEKQLLREIGYGLVLDCDVETGESLFDHKHYQYRVNRGPVCVPEKNKQQRNCFRGDSLRALANEQLLTRDHMLESKRLLRYVLSQYLDGRKLKSREIMQQAYLHKKRHQIT